MYNYEYYRKNRQSFNRTFMELKYTNVLVQKRV